MLFDPNQMKEFRMKEHKKHHGDLHASHKHEGHMAHHKKDGGHKHHGHHSNPLGFSHVGMSQAFGIRKK